MTGVDVQNPMVLQLNFTWVYGGTPPSSLEYAYSDYPNMFLYNDFGQPVPPFKLALSTAQTSQVEGVVTTYGVVVYGVEVKRSNEDLSWR